MKTITVKEAVQRVENGESLKGFVLDDQTSRQVNVRDAMVLNRGGIVVPEKSLFYDDSEIEDDESIDDIVVGREITGMSWEEKARLFSVAEAVSNDVKVDLSTEQPEINDWITQNRAKLEGILKPIVVGLFNAEKAFK